MSFFVPTRFVWRFGGRQVHLCGSFTRWVETIPMAPVDGTPGVFAVVVHLPPGYHQYKFIVDGKWMHDETAPYMPDPLGNVNNWLFVRKIDPPAAVAAAAGAAPNGLMLDTQQHLLSQLQEQQVAAAAAALTQQQQAQVAHAHAAAAAQQAVQAQAQQVMQAQMQQAAQLQHQQAAAAAQPQLQQQQPPQQQPLHTGGLPAGFGAQHQQQRAVLQQAVAHPAGSAGVGPAAMGGHPGMLQPGAVPGPAAAGVVAGGSGPLQAQVVAPAAPEATDVEMTGGEAAAAASVLAPIIIQNEREPDLTKKKVSDFLHGHTAYELIPESGKVVLLDVDLPVRQAFHALHEQGIASAPLYDGRVGCVVGVISASDFIHMLRRLKSAVSSGNNPLSEAEMDAHSIRAMREECVAEGRPPQRLVYVRTSDKLATVVRTLSEHKCSMAPILTADPSDEPGSRLPSVLHIATLSGVLNCLMRHFRASLASLPLLALPLSQLPIGTWAPEQQFTPGGAQQQQQLQQAALAAGGDGVPTNGGCAAASKRSSAGSEAAAAAAAGSDGGGGMDSSSSGGGIAGRNVTPLHAVTPTTPLTTALGLLLEAGVSALPVVNEAGALLDIYARSDITQLVKGNAYSRLQWEDVTVGQALCLSSPNPVAWQQQGGSGHLALPDYTAANPHLADAQLRGGAPPGGYAAGSLAAGRVAVAFIDDPLRAVVERLAAPGVRRLVVVDRASRRVLGLVSLSDVAAYLFL